MEFSEFRKKIVELNAQMRFCDRIENVFETETPRLPDASKGQIRNTVLPIVFARATEMIETGDWPGLWTLPIEFGMDLRRRVIYELTHGSLKTATKSSEMIRCGPALTANGYNAEEQDFVPQLMQDGQRVGRITPRAIEILDLDGLPCRTITRADFDTLRPAGWSNRASWEQQYTPESRIREIEEAQRQGANAASTPQCGRNLDFGPTGIRPR